LIKLSFSSIGKHFAKEPQFLGLFCFPVFLFIHMKEYVIKAGNHYNTSLLKTLPFISLSNHSVKFFISFDSNCEYELADYNQGDVNKLFGFTYGIKGDHWNSARFGWRWSRSGKCIELLAYTYSNGVKNWDSQLRYPVVASVGLNEVIELEIVADKDTYYFYATKKGEDKKLITVTHDAGFQLFGFSLGFYFGGEKTIDHDCSIKSSKETF
jgi:hypothetical protein